MVGGGPGAGIGRTHRCAADLDGQYRLLAGAFSRDLAKSRAIGEELGLSPERVYRDFETMAAEESKRSDGIQCVSIVTPNNTHAAISLAFMSRGVHAICDKPMTTSFSDAVKIMESAKDNGVLFALTHNYSAYPMLIEARHLVNSGAVGAIRLVQAEYAQGSRNRLVEAEGDAKMAWRVDREIGGPSTVLGDLGTHAHHLMRFITGLEIESLSADLTTVVPGRKSDDNAISACGSRAARAGNFGRVWRQPATAYASECSAKRRACIGITRRQTSCRCVPRAGPIGYCAGASRI